MKNNQRGLQQNFWSILFPQEGKEVNENTLSTLLNRDMMYILD